MLVETDIADPRWADLGLEPLAEQAARATLAHLGLAPDGFLVALLACDDARIATLNAQYRGKPAPTNVLSWPSAERAPDEPGGTPDLPDPGAPDDPEELGDIAIAYDTVAREAADQGKTPQAHVSHLVVHAVLHLLGYDHIDDADAAVMEACEVAILAKLGHSDPY